jgi:U3 small nucleolar RNA-associated protein 14
LKAPRKNNEVLVAKDSSAIEKSKGKLKKQAQKREEEKAKARDDAIVEISMDNVLTLEIPAPTDASPDNPENAMRKTSSAQGADDDSDVHSEVEEQERVLTSTGGRKARGVHAFEQRELVARAFAGDNVVEVGSASQPRMYCV